MSRNNTVVLPPLKWWDLFHRVEKRPSLQPAGNGGDSSLRGYMAGERPNFSEGWNGANWTGAMTMMRDGWQDGAKQVDAVMATMPEAEALADAWNLEAAGRFPCVPAFLSGDPECMWQTSEVDGTKPRICLVVSARYHCGIEPEHVIRYGAAVCATLRALEAAGFGVAIYSVDKARSRGTIAQACIVRDFGEPLDTSVVAFAFHPSYLRRVLFAHTELSQEWSDAGCSYCGYGMPVEANLADAAACLGEFPATPVVLSGVQTCEGLGLLRKGQTAELLNLFKTEVQKALEIA